MTAISIDGSRSIASVGRFVVMTSIPNVSLQLADAGDHFYYQSTLALNLQFLNAGLPAGVSFDPNIPLFGDNPFDLSFSPSLDTTVIGNHANYHFEATGEGIQNWSWLGRK